MDANLSPEPIAPASPPPPPALPPVPSAQPPVAPPVVPPAAPEEGPDLSSLSPSAVLGRHGVTPPASSLPSAPTSTPTGGVTREELLRQAAQAPDSRLILPQPHLDDDDDSVPISGPRLGELRTETKTHSVEGVKLSSRADHPGATELASMAQATRAALPAEKGSLLSAETKEETPKKPLEPPVPVTMKPMATAHAVPPSLSSPLPKSPSRKGGLLGALLGLLLIILIGLGAAFFLAYQGARVPLLYPWVSGLSGSGIDQAHASLTAVNTHQRYGYAKGSKLTVNLLGAATPPALPTETTSTDSVSISMLKADVSNGSRTTKDDSFAGTLNIVADQGTGVPLELNAIAPTWNVRLPFATTPTIQSVTPAPIAQSLLITVLQPLSLKTVLESVKTEKSYTKGTYSGQKIATYQYDLQPDKIKTLLPTGSSFDTVSAVVSYAWKTGLPIEVTVNGTFKLTDTTYTFSSTALYTGWNVAIPSEVADLTTAKTPPVLAPADLVAQLGMVPKNLPGLDPAVASSLPSDLPAITPSGKTVTVAGTALPTINPPIPATPATDAAKARDTQRRQDLTDLQTALERYKTIVGSYPIASAPFEQTGSSATLLKALVPNYLTAMPVDPTPDTYWYEYSSDGSTFRLRSVAEDASRPEAKQGVAFHYYEFTNK